MTLKLNGSSSGSVSIDAPASTTGGADVTLTLPVNDGDANQFLQTNGSGVLSFAGAKTSTYPSSIQILEQFFCPCDGSVIATSNGNITIEDKDDVQLLTTSYADVTGSSIAYTPPTGTTQVIYEYQYHHGRVDDTPTAHFKLFIDSDEVTDARTTFSPHYGNGLFTIKWGINIGGSAVTATGRQASWSSSKTIKLQAREYSSNSEVALNKSNVWDGSASDTFHRPSIGITAIGAA